MIKSLILKDIFNNQFKGGTISYWVGTEHRIVTFGKWKELSILLFGMNLDSGFIKRKGLFGTCWIKLTSDKKDCRDLSND